MLITNPKIVETCQRMGIKNTIYLMDRGFYGSELVNYFEGTGVKFLMPCRGSKKYIEIVRRYGNDKQIMFTKWVIENKECNAMCYVQFALRNEENKKMDYGKNTNELMENKYIEFITNCNECVADVFIKMGN